MAKQTKITKSARGEDCTVRIEGICKNNTETTVYAHLNGGGVGAKVSDAHGCYACFDCHEWLDGGYIRTPNMQRYVRDLRHLEAVIRTQNILLNKGLLVIF